MKTTAIFDLDGTLLYTLSDLTDSVNYALTKYNLPTLSVEKVRSFIGDGVKKLMERAVCEKLNEEELDKCLACFKEHYKDNMYNKTCPYEGVLVLIDKLREKGIKIAVVSNKFDKAVKELCKFYFGEKIDIAKGECETVKKKPASDGVLEAIKELQEKPQNCVYIGDSEIDILTAKNAKIDCISVDWGYKNREFLVENGAGTIVSDCIQLYEAILKY